MVQRGTRLNEKIMKLEPDKIYKGVINEKGFGSMQQIKNQFDAVTVNKILKGSLIAGTCAIGLYILGWLGTLNYGNVWTPIVGSIIPIIANTIREFRKGAAGSEK